MKYDFTKVPILTLEDTLHTENMSEMLANSLYYTATNIGLSELGKDIYKKKGSVEIEKKLLADLIIHINKVSAQGSISSLAAKSLNDFLTNKKPELPEIVKKEEVPTEVAEQEIPSSKKR